MAILMTITSYDDFFQTMSRYILTTEKIVYLLNCMHLEISDILPFQICQIILVGEGSLLITLKACRECSAALWRPAYQAGRRLERHAGTTQLYYWMSSPVGLCGHT